MQLILSKFTLISLPYTVLKKCYDNVKLSLKKHLSSSFFFFFHAKISLKPTRFYLSVN